MCLSELLCIVSCKCGNSSPAREGGKGTVDVMMISLSWWLKQHVRTNHCEAICPKQPSPLRLLHKHTSSKFFWQGHKISSRNPSFSLLISTEECIFMDKRVREISRFFVAPPRVFPLSVWRVSRKLLSRNTSGLVQNKDQEYWSRQ